MSRSEVQGVLEVRLIEGKNLAIRDRSGTSDPYVEIRFGKTKKTSTVKWKTLNPVWRETFLFHISDKTKTIVDLDIRVKDKDKFVFSKDDSLGQFSINLTDYMDGQTHDLWVTLDNIETGELHMALTYTIFTGELRQSLFALEVLPLEINDKSVPYEEYSKFLDLPEPSANFKIAAETEKTPSEELLDFEFDLGGVSFTKPADEPRTFEEYLASMCNNEEFADVEFLVCPVEDKNDEDAAEGKKKKKRRDDSDDDSSDSDDSDSEDESDEEEKEATNKSASSSSSSLADSSIRKSIFAHAIMLAARAEGLKQLPSFPSYRNKHQNQTKEQRRKDMENKAKKLKQQQQNKFHLAADFSFGKNLKPSQPRNNLHRSTRLALGDMSEGGDLKTPVRRKEKEKEKEEKRGGWGEGERARIMLPTDIKYDVFLALMEWIYTGTVNRERCFGYTLRDRSAEKIKEEEERKKEEKEEKEEEFPPVSWTWHNDSAYVPYSADLCKTLEKTYQLLKRGTQPAPSARVQIDSERFVDLSNINDVQQRRYDDESRCRKVQRQEPSASSSLSSSTLTSLFSSSSSLPSRAPPMTPQQRTAADDLIQRVKDLAAKFHLPQPFVDACLSCINYTSNPSAMTAKATLISDLQKTVNSAEYSTVTIVVLDSGEDEAEDDLRASFLDGDLEEMELSTYLYYGHPLFLCGSPWFKAMLSSGLREAQSRIMELFEISKRSMRLLLEFLHTGRMAEVKTDLTLDFLRLSDQYLLPFGIRECMERIIAHCVVEVENAIVLYHFSLLNNAPRLTQFIHEFIVRNKFWSSRSIRKSQKQGLSTLDRNKFPGA
ncbi:hypothetical protein QOT17_014858 [Balamuthia mandrillaris]